MPALPPPRIPRQTNVAEDDDNARSIPGPGVLPCSPRAAPRPIRRSPRHRARDRAVAARGGGREGLARRDQQLRDRSRARAPGGPRSAALRRSRGPTRAPRRPELQDRHGARQRLGGRERRARGYHRHRHGDHDRCREGKPVTVPIANQTCGAARTASAGRSPRSRMRRCSRRWLPAAGRTRSTSRHPPGAPPNAAQTFRQRTRRKRSRAAHCSSPRNKSNLALARSPRPDRPGERRAGPDRRPAARPFRKSVHRADRRQERLVDPVAPPFPPLEAGAGVRDDRVLRVSRPEADSSRSRSTAPPVPAIDRQGVGAGRRGCRAGHLDDIAGSHSIGEGGDSAAGAGMSVPERAPRRMASSRRRAGQARRDRQPHWQAVECQAKPQATDWSDLDPESSLFPSIERFPSTGTSRRTGSGPGPQVEIRDTAPGAQSH